jgi:hypothetical protein
MVGAAAAGVARNRELLRFGHAARQLCTNLDDQAQ